MNRSELNHKMQKMEDAMDIERIKEYEADLENGDIETYSQDEMMKMLGLLHEKNITDGELDECQHPVKKYEDMEKEGEVLKERINDLISQQEDLRDEQESIEMEAYDLEERILDLDQEIVELENQMNNIEKR